MEYTNIETDLCDSTGAKYEYAEVDSDGSVRAYKRADGDWDVPVDVDADTLEFFEKMASEEGVSVEALMSKIVTERLIAMIAESKTAANSDEGEGTDEL